MDLDAGIGGSITNNYFKDIPGVSAIILRRGAGITVGGNTFNGCGPNLQFLVSQYVGGLAQGVTVLPQIRGDAGVIVDNLVGADARQDSVTQWDMTTGGAVTDQVLLRLALPSNRSCTLDLFIEGANSVGQFALSHREIIGHDPNSAITVAGSAGDMVTGTGASGLTLKYDTVTVPGYVFVKLSSTGNLTGNIRARAVGNMTYFASGVDPQGLGNGPATDARLIAPIQRLDLQSQGYGARLIGTLIPNVGAMFNLQALDNGAAVDALTIDKAYGAYRLHAKVPLLIEQGITAVGALITTDGYRVTRYVVAPTSATSPGTPGDVSSDGNYFYFFTGSSSNNPMWKRVAISAW